MTAATPEARTPEGHNLNDVRKIGEFPALVLKSIYFSVQFVKGDLHPSYGRDVMSEYSNSDGICLASAANRTSSNNALGGKGA